MEAPRVRRCCGHATATFGPGVEIIDRVADPFPELVESGSAAQRAVAFQRVRFEGEVAGGRIGIDEADWSGLLDEPGPTQDVRRRPTTLRVGVPTHGSPPYSRRASCREGRRGFHQSGDGTRSEEHTSEL